MNFRFLCSKDFASYTRKLPIKSLKMRSWKSTRSKLPVIGRVSGGLGYSGFLFLHMLLVSVSESSIFLHKSPLFLLYSLPGGKIVGVYVCVCVCIWGKSSKFWYSVVSIWRVCWDSSAVQGVHSTKTNCHRNHSQTQSGWIASSKAPPAWRELQSWSARRVLMVRRLLYIWSWDVSHAIPSLYTIDDILRVYTERETLQLLWVFGQKQEVRMNVG